MPFYETIITGTLASNLPQYTSTPSSLMVSGTVFPFVQDKFGVPALKLLNAVQMGQMLGVITGSHTLLDGKYQPSGTTIPSNGWILSTNTWSYLSADSPSFVASVNANVTGTIGVGDRVWLTQHNQNRYFIVTAVSITGSTSYLNMYGGTDYALSSSGTITNPYYSQIHAPFGFPLNPTKWTVRVTDTSDRTQASPVVGTWYNLGSVSISIPIGVWRISYSVAVYGDKAAAGTIQINTTLSTANNSESTPAHTAGTAVVGVTGTTFLSRMFPTILSLASKTTYFLNSRAQNGTYVSLVNFNSSTSTLILEAVCIYL